MRAPAECSPCAHRATNVTLLVGDRSLGLGFRAGETPPSLLPFTVDVDPFASPGGVTDADGEGQKGRLGGGAIRTANERLSTTPRPDEVNVTADDNRQRPFNENGVTNTRSGPKL